MRKVGKCDEGTKVVKAMKEAPTNANIELVCSSCEHRLVHNE